MVEVSSAWILTWSKSIDSHTDLCPIQSPTPRHAHDGMLRRTIGGHVPHTSQARGTRGVHDHAFVALVPLPLELPVRLGAAVPHARDAHVHDRAVDGVTRDVNFDGTYPRVGAHAVQPPEALDYLLDPVVDLLPTRHVDLGEHDVVVLGRRRQFLWGGRHVRDGDFGLE